MPAPLMSSTSEVTDDKLAAGYRECARLTRAFGTTYFWGAALLPRPQRRHVYAVYALCRLADDIVDDTDVVRTETLAQTTGRLQAFADHFRTALDTGDSDDPVMAAIVHSVAQADIDPECFDRFFGAMAMDLSQTRYETWEDLCGYMEGSAAVIGEMMLPVLQPTSKLAREPARALGLAFQLTNFLRDIDEDLDRGRVYLPQEDLRSFGVDIEARTVTDAWRALLGYQIARNRGLYWIADTGIRFLPPASARCVGTARVLYAQILERIENADYDVFSGRARVPTWRKATTAGRILIAGPSATRKPRNDLHVTQDAV